MVLVNKAVLNTVPLPITFLWIQILVAVLLLWNSSLLGLLKLPTLTTQNCSKVMPLIFINVIGLTLNTLCLQYVDASFYQVARALVLPFTVILSRVCLKQTISASVLFSCVLVFFGFLLGTVFEGPAIVVSVLGTTLGVASSVSTAVHAIVIKTSLGAVNGNTIDLVYYNNVLSLVMLAPVVLFSGEVSKVLDIIELAWTGALANESLLTTEDAEKQLFALVVGGFVTGIFGFLINVAGFFQIKVTSPLSHMISSAFRGVLQTVLAVLLFNDVISSSRIMSIALVLIGSALYAWAKNQESNTTSSTFQSWPFRCCLQPVIVYLKWYRKK
ncbi:hypothetical protein BCR33DRAFT_753051 [Rhizoclosmatium globosum]|uniref:Sugar phosphate transporter domain-containing protein n=1 Tax=Rhizoclosmatium globosum TaxID=329046 RepID=A0A1Y2CU79_9FUNG|nr:hypothetical protein BCR33DRAFT_753051 [Rhizoclosmatium globosum]|eukprot:ORY49895.1 hypothetical protein BCR33DRAFT_753051 [Rhizoclosmatium globosum]